jgi:predicted GIY-YIG superfamily endonuclease
MNQFFVYMLRCSDGHYYVGHTDDLNQRIAQHESGAIPSCFTFSRRPLILVYSQDFQTRDDAFCAEMQIKGWSRKKKEALIRGEWEELSRLANPRKLAN